MIFGIVIVILLLAILARTGTPRKRSALDWIMLAIVGVPAIFLGSVILVVIVNSYLP